ncbi:DUF3570 domain-containing protein [Tenacibaculum sp. TC6]|uniref:DUF3570 domain-containing protein n=1 Tax=Tenacibaculum sp. TC6 TaxID=3423223 RepID=UPI003D360AAA
MLKILCFFLISVALNAQENQEKKTYKKRVLEATELELLASYYTQDGSNASVTGGIGTEKLSDVATDIVVSIPLNDDDILIVDAGISAYTSASSSNLNPFDGKQPADPFVASSGASQADNLISVSGTYSHSSEDRNTVWSANVSFANEFDYTSFGFGGSITKLFNEKNTELSVNANVFLDSWSVIYPYELGGGRGGEGHNWKPFNINDYVVTGNLNYLPKFTPYNKTNRNTYSLGISFSQILSKRAQMSFLLDLTQQEGLLANHMQRVYFSDVANTYIENFHLADDVERLPGTRFKTALGTRFNYYINEQFVVRTFYRYYFDNWNIQSHTASIELPFKLTDKWTLYPSYRYYTQTAATYFAPYDQHISTSSFYTSDYDLSMFIAHQYGVGVSYSNPFSSFKISKFRFKSFDIKYDYYKRNTGLKASIISGGATFIFD